MMKKMQLIVSALLTVSMLAGVGFFSIAATSGAIWTTDAGKTVNQNHFSAKSDVYLNGGPHKDSGNLTDGAYFVRILQPQGQMELGYSTTANVTVSGGKFAEVYRLIDLVRKTSDSAPGDFDTSSNNVYKVQIGKYDASKAKSKTGFDINNADDREACWGMLKSDNFTIGGDGYITVTKIVENENPSSQKFYIQLSDKNDITSVYELTPGVPYVISNLLLGEYEMKEINIPEGYSFKSMTTDSVQLKNSNKSASVTITNTKNAVASPSPSPEVEVSPSPSPEVVASPSPSPEVEASPSPSPEVEASPSPSPEVEASPSPSPEVVASPSPSPEVEPSPSPSPEVVASPSPSPEVVASPSPSPEVVASPSPSPEVEASPSPSPEVVASPSPSEAPIVPPVTVSIPGPAIESVTLTTAVIGQGTVLPSSGSNSFDKGTTVQLSATPATGWQFSGWQGDSVDGNNQIYMDGNKSVTAVFAEIPAPVVTLPAEQVPQAPAAQVTEPASQAEESQTLNVAEETVPAAPASLPKTGGLPAGLFYGFGGLLTAAGLLLKKVQR